MRSRKSVKCGMGIEILQKCRSIRGDEIFAIQLRKANSSNTCVRSRHVRGLMLPRRQLVHTSSVIASLIVFLENGSEPVTPFPYHISLRPYPCS